MSRVRQKSPGMFPSLHLSFSSCYDTISQMDLEYCGKVLDTFTDSFNTTREVCDQSEIHSAAGQQPQTNQNKNYLQQQGEPHFTSLLDFLLKTLYSTVFAQCQTTHCQKYL